MPDRSDTLSKVKQFNSLRSAFVTFSFSANYIERAATTGNTNTKMPVAHLIVPSTFLSINTNAIMRRQVVPWLVNLTFSMIYILS